MKILFILTILTLVSQTSFAANPQNTKSTKKKISLGDTYNSNAFQLNSVKLEDKSRSLKIDTSSKKIEQKARKFWDNLDWIGGDLNRAWLETNGSFSMPGDSRDIADFSGYNLATNPRQQTFILSKYGADDKSIKDLFSNPEYSNYLTRIRSLNLRSSNFSVDDLKELNKAIDKLKQVLDVYLGGNNLGDEGVGTLVRMTLPHLSQLQILDLESNNLSAQGIRYLAGVLPSVIQIRALYLGSNNLGEEGLNQLLNSLPHLRQLRILSLKSNNIGSGGMKKFANYVVHLSQLQILDLKSNNIGDEGVVSLMKQFSQMNQIQFLDLEGNNISQAVKDEVKKTAIKQLPNLKEIWM
jgi:Leucine Rich repeat